jgi:hypothetical protein
MLAVGQCHGMAKALVVPAAQHNPMKRHRDNHLYGGENLLRPSEAPLPRSAKNARFEKMCH